MFHHTWHSGCREQPVTSNTNADTDTQQKLPTDSEMVAKATDIRDTFRSCQEMERALEGRLQQSAAASSLRKTCQEKKEKEEKRRKEEKRKKKSMGGWHPRQSGCWTVRTIGL